MSGNKGGGDDGQGKDFVNITVNNSIVPIHRGNRTVIEIKEAGKVPLADELAQVVEGHPLKPLPDGGSVVIKGGEEFVSYPKDSGSSFASSR